MSVGEDSTADNTYCRAIPGDVWSGRGLSLQDERRHADLLILNVNYAIGGRVELRDLHKLLQERVLGTIHVGSEADITGVIKKPLASTVL
jgi:hypothetical protein